MSLKFTKALSLMLAVLTLVCVMPMSNIAHALMLSGNLSDLIGDEIPIAPLPFTPDLDVGGSSAPSLPTINSSHPLKVYFENTPSYSSPIALLNDKPSGKLTGWYDVIDVNLNLGYLETKSNGFVRSSYIFGSNKAVQEKIKYSGTSNIYVYPSWEDVESGKTYSYYIEKNDDVYACATGTYNGVRFISVIYTLTGGAYRAAYIKATDYYAMGGKYTKPTTPAPVTTAPVTAAPVTPTPTPKPTAAPTPKPGEVTRADFVMELYKLAGSPAIWDDAVNPFTDVKKSDSFYNAVLWAYYCNPQITSGTSATTFSPNAYLTRSQVVTFMYSYADKPAVSGTEPFTDVTTEHWFYKPVVWAYNNGITVGTSSTTFSPDIYCTQSMVKIFINKLSSYMGNKKPNSLFNYSVFITSFDELMNKKDKDGITVVLRIIENLQNKKNPIYVSFAGEHYYVFDEIAVKSSVFMSENATKSITVGTKGNTIEEFMTEKYGEGTSTVVDQYYVSSNYQVSTAGIFNSYNYYDVKFAYVQHAYIPGEYALDTKMVWSGLLRIIANGGSGISGTVDGIIETGWLLLTPTYDIGYKTKENGVDTIESKYYFQLDENGNPREDVPPLYMQSIEIISNADNEADESKVSATMKQFKPIWSTAYSVAKAYFCKFDKEAVGDAVAEVVDYLLESKTESGTVDTIYYMNKNMSPCVERNIYPTDAKVTSPVSIYTSGEHIKLKIGFSGNSIKDSRKLIKIKFSMKEEKKLSFWDTFSEPDIPDAIM